VGVMTTKRAPCLKPKLQRTGACDEWMATHMSTKMLEQHRPRVLAALVLQSAWRMEWGEGCPVAECLVKLLECTRHGHGHGLAFPQHGPLLAMQFFQHSAYECGKQQLFSCSCFESKSAPQTVAGQGSQGLSRLGGGGGGPRHRCRVFKS
jgi:hypothetical protein